MEALAEDIAKFRGKYMVGWDKLRDARYARQIKLRVIDPAWPLSPRPPEVKPWDSLIPEQKDRFDYIMAIYAACAYHLDKEVGVLVAGLAQRGLLDNTLILFLSDNGGNYESGTNGTLEGTSPGGPDSTVFCGQSWATLENIPFRRYKHFEHEGGISSSLIVHWPAGIPAKNSLRDQQTHLIDIMATRVEVSGAQYPTRFDGHDIHPMDGRSLVPAFTNQPVEHDAIYWEHEGNAAVLQGDWKLVRFRWNGVWELYNLKADRTGQHDLSASQPDKVKQLSVLWNDWAKRIMCSPSRTSNSPCSPAMTVMAVPRRYVARRRPLETRRPRKNDYFSQSITRSIVLLECHTHDYICAAWLAARSIRRIVSINVALPRPGKSFWQTAKEQLVFASLPARFLA